MKRPALEQANILMQRWQRLTPGGPSSKNWRFVAEPQYQQSFMPRCPFAPPSP